MLITLDAVFPSPSIGFHSHFGLEEVIVLIELRMCSGSIPVKILEPAAISLNSFRSFST